jgi:hypothetical protein
VRLGLGVALLSFAGVARAEPPHGRVVLLRTLEISGHIQKPLAAVEINRVEPKLTLSELRPTFADRIGTAIAHDPY